MATSSIRISLSKDGQIIEDAEVEMPDFADGTPIIDLLAAAFVKRDGLYSYPNPAFDAAKPESGDENKKELSVNPYRNYLMRVRQFSTVVLNEYVKSLGVAQAVAAAETAVSSVPITVKEHK